MNEIASHPSASVCARQVVKHYEAGRITALSGVDMDVAPGEFVAICGPSGCGKSTLLNMLSAIDEPDSGTLTVAGQTLGELRPEQADAYRRGVVGLVFQLHNLLPNLTAMENVQVPMIGSTADGAARVNRARTLLDRVGLSSRAHALPTKMSGGERQRVAIARALANSPRLLLADEPTGALDSRTGDQIMDLIGQLQKCDGLTVIIVTHEQRVAERADRVVHMLDGRIVDS